MKKKTNLDILQRLDETTQLNFLKELYTPGDERIANLILKMEPQNTEILEEEIKYAKLHNHDERFIELAKQYIELCIEHNWDIRGKLIEWDNTDIAKYTVERIEQLVQRTKREEEKEYWLMVASDIAERFEPEKAKILLEELLELQLKNKDKDPCSPVETCIKLGYYDKAIELSIEAIQKGYDLLKEAMEIARKHTPGRLTELASIGFRTYKRHKNLEIYVESAKILGEIDKAKKTLAREARKLQPRGTPAFYKMFVKSLLEFGLTEEAKAVVKKVEKQERDESTQKNYDLDRLKELAELLYEIGNEESAKHAYLTEINRKIEDGWNPANVIMDVEEACKLLENPRELLEIKMQLLGRIGEYPEAAKLAKRLGKNDLADTYEEMHRMIQKVKKYK